MVLVIASLLNLKKEEFISFSIIIKFDIIVFHKSELINSNLFLVYSSIGLKSRIFMKNQIILGKIDYLEY